MVDNPFFWIILLNLYTIGPARNDKDTCNPAVNASTADLNVKRLSEAKFQDPDTAAEWHAGAYKERNLYSRACIEWA